MNPPRRNGSPSLGWITWSSLGLGAQGLGQFALLAVLSRYLTAVEFGVVSATLIAIGVCRVVHASIGPALVQREDLQPAHVRSAFAISVWSAAAMVAALWLLAPAVAAFFRADDLVPVMRWMSLVFLCQAPGLVPEALLQRDMNLRALALAEVAGVALGYLPLGIGGAVLGWHAGALVAAHVGQALVKSLVLVTARAHPRALLPERAATRDLLAYSGGVVTAGLCNFAASQGDNVVVGRWMSAAHLGIYGRAYQLMAMPAMFLGEVVDRIVFPLMARFQDDKPRLAIAYGRGVALVAAVMTPAAIAGVLLAPEIVRVVLGDRWDEVVAPFQVLMAGLVFRTGYKISDLLARATGTVYARAWRQAVFAALIFGGALLGSLGGVTGVAIGIVAALAVNYLMMAGLSLGTTGMTWRRFGALHVRGLLLGAAFGGVVLAVRELAHDAGAGPLTTIAAALSAGLIGLGAAIAMVPHRVLGGDGLWLWQTLRGGTAKGTAP